MRGASWCVWAKGRMQRCKGWSCRTTCCRAFEQGERDDLMLPSRSDLPTLRRFQGPLSETELSLAF